MLILKPLQYLRIEHGTKRLWDFVYPAIVATTMLALQCFLSLDLQFVGPDGVLRQVNGLLGVLSGFYIASLTALSVIQTPSLAEKMAGQAPKLPVMRRGRRYKKELKRGEFMRYLFGYLSLLSIIVFFVGVIIDVLYYPVVSEYPGVAESLWWMQAATLFVYSFVLSNIIINTMVGIYYLSDRMHRVSDRGIVKVVDDQEDD